VPQRPSQQARANVPEAIIAWRAISVLPKSMWIFGGARSKVRRIEGDVVQRRCADCERTTSHIPVKVKDSFHLFFVEFADLKSTGLQCQECGEVATDDAAKAAATQRDRIDEHGLEDLGSGARTPRVLNEADLAVPALPTTRPVIADPDAISMRRRPKADRPVDQARVDDELAALKAAARKK